MPTLKPSKKIVAHNDPKAHEGARESTTPGEPRSREVITPDWAELDKKNAVRPKSQDPRPK